MYLNDLFDAKKIEPRDVLVMRHRPYEPELNKVLPLLAAEKPDLFNAYQQTQGEKVERAMTRAKYVASFIGDKPGKALFVGLYAIGASRPITREQFWAMPAYIEMKKFGMAGYKDEDKRPLTLFFDLELTDFYAQWKGKLVVGWPPPERSWWRRAHKNDMPVLAVYEDNALESAMPKWHSIDFTWSRLSILPAAWEAKLAEWRAIYYIFDASDGKGYVGAAYGDTNLLGRWRNYAASGHGDNKLLRQRDPQNFRFSILQRVSPDMEASDVIRLEASWKERLHTRDPSGLNDN